VLPNYHPQFLAADGKSSSNAEWSLALPVIKFLILFKSRLLTSTRYLKDHYFSNWNMFGTFLEEKKFSQISTANFIYFYYAT
jgi:hypothetical protein